METKKVVVLGVTGGIAAYKALDIVSRLKKLDIDVHVIMTDSAEHFITPLSFQSMSQNAVITDMFKEPKTFEIQHISLAKKADVFIVVPATANIIGKVANGIADDMLSTTIMATRAPVLFAPAMNTNMYENVIVQKNIASLKALGYSFVEPAFGRLACGDVGRGKLADAEDIMEHIEMLLHNNKELSGKKFLITAGPNCEDIDPVRYITNRSSGKMGYALAKAARNRGADVTLVSGPVSLKKPYGMKVIDIYSAEDMYKAVDDHFEGCDVLIGAAAVADYRPKEVSSSKIKKTDDDMFIPLTRNKDIMKEMGIRKTHQILVGFAAETDNLLENAKAKIQKKNLDMIVANDVKATGSGFKSDTNTARIIKSFGEILDLPNMPKEQLSDAILDCIVEIKKR
jgi:phosphopantothenoylcysteine decarboxylase/phosphopantothenate--cysteine ligase